MVSPIAARSETQPLSFDQFLAWEQRQERRHEYVDGQVVAMAGGTEAHNTIRVNLIAATAPKLRGSRCRPFASDMLVRTGNGRGRYPDMTIDCGPRDGTNLFAPEPVAVFEVLSPETQKFDRTVKLADYNQTPSIRHYVLIEPAEPLVHVYSRGPFGDFNRRPEEVCGLDAVVDLPAVGISLGMRDVYDGIELLAA